MAFDVISEIGFGAPFGFVQKGSDVGSLIKGFRDGLPFFGLMARLYTFTDWVKETWIGEQYLVAKPEHKTGFGLLLRFRDKLIKKRIEEIEAGVVDRKIDLLQT